MPDALAQLVAPQLRVVHDLGISLLVALNRLLVAQRRIVGILAKLIVCAALARQVPSTAGRVRQRERRHSDDLRHLGTGRFAFHRCE